MASASPVQGYVVTPYLECFNESQSALASLQASLAPANDATMPVGTPVIFTGRSTATPTFAVASSAPALLASPDIDTGVGSAQPEAASSEPSTYSYSFTSTKASATPGTVYWDASFSNAGFKDCKGETPQTYTTQPRTLTVLAPPAPAVPSTPPPAPLVETSPLQVSISAIGSFHLAHPTALYASAATPAALARPPIRSSWCAAAREPST